jgi:hypothetical protein
MPYAKLIMVLKFEILQVKRIKLAQVKWQHRNTSYSMQGFTVRMQIGHET